MGGFGVILMPKKISTTTTLDYFEIYDTFEKHGTKFQKIHNDFKTWYKTSEISQNFKTGYREKVHLFVEKK